MIKSKKQMFIVIGVFTLVMLLGSVTYAFFNYTRTGASNVIKTGRIYFNTTQSGNINLTNAFPIKASDLATDVGNHDTVTINITGDTTYSEGIEYLVTLETNAFNNIYSEIGLPISLDVNVNGLGENDNDYYYKRGGDTPIYRLTNSETIIGNQYLLTGYIPKGENGVNGSIDITAYLDTNKISITDTYPARSYYQINDNLTDEQISQCVNILSSLNATEEFCRGTGTIIMYNNNYTFQRAVSSNMINQNLMNRLTAAGITKELYTDGTTYDWTYANNRRRYTTESWNRFNENGINFKIKIEANEGIWVEDYSTPVSCFGIETHAVRNPNMDINKCVEIMNTFEKFERFQLDNGATYESFCNGTGTINGLTFDELVNRGLSHPFISAGLVTSDSNSITYYNDYDCGSEAVIPTNVKLYKYKRNPNMTVDKCINYFSPIISEAALGRPDEILLEGETLESFCNGTGTLTNITLDEFIDMMLMGSFEMDVGEFVVNDGVAAVLPITGISDRAFKYGDTKSIKIPKSITTIGVDAFSNNKITSLSIDMPNIPDNFASNNNLTGLTNLSIGPNVQTIGQNAFSNNSLTSLKIYNGVEEIGNNAFTGNSLTNVVVPNTVINQPWEDTGNGQCKYFDSNVTISWNNESHTCPA